MSDDLSPALYEALAEFRFQIRRFQRFSDDAARSAEIEPQQHQLLLAVKAAPEGHLTIGAVADRLQVQHHSAAELVARAEGRGLVERTPGQTDRRQVFVSLTDAGTEALVDLSAAHRRELQTAAPELIRILQRIVDGENAAD